MQNQEGPPLADPLAAALPRVRQVDASAMLLLSLAARVVPPHPTHLLPQTTRIPRILQILRILERPPEIPGYLGGLRDHVRSGIPVPILAGATAATCVLETSCNILPYVRLNSPYQHTSSYASMRYL